jgi:hypothetical protein
MSKVVNELISISVYEYMSKSEKGEMLNFEFLVLSFKLFRGPDVAQSIPATLLHST